MPAPTDARFSERVAPLIGLPVSRAWRGYGSAIFLELGELTPDRRGQLFGVATVMIEWSWRVESARAIAFGSFSSDRMIAAGLGALVDRRIESVEVFGRLPEVTVGLSGGRWVSSFSTVQGQPAWALLLRERGTISVRRGAVVHSAR